MNFQKFGKKFLAVNLNYYWY